MIDNKLPSHNLYIIIAGKASVFTSKKRKAGITAEAALAVPLFFMAVISLLYLLEIMAVQTAVRSGMQSAGRRAAAKAYAVPAVTPGNLEADIINAIGVSRLNRSIITGGSQGLHLESSRMSAVTGICEIAVSYQIQLPVAIFAAAPVTYHQEMTVKGWTGYVKSGFGGKDVQTVYVTETGLVYHKNYQCTYLELSIRMVPAGEVSGLRNEDGARYYPCEHCMHGSAGGVYITDSGSRYHSSLGCSGLKRTVYAVPISEAAGKGACSRCGS